MLSSWNDCTRETVAPARTLVFPPAAARAGVGGKTGTLPASLAQCGRGGSSAQRARRGRRVGGAAHAMTPPPHDEPAQPTQQPARAHSSSACTHAQHAARRTVSGVVGRGVAAAGPPRAAAVSQPESRSPRFAAHDHQRRSCAAAGLAHMLARPPARRAAARVAGRGVDVAPGRPAPAAISAARVVTPLRRKCPPAPPTRQEGLKQC